MYTHDLGHWTALLKIENGNSYEGAFVGSSVLVLDNDEIVGVNDAGSLDTMSQTYMTTFYPRSHLCWQDDCVRTPPPTIPHISIS